VDPAQQVLAVADLPLHQGHMVLAVELVDIAVGQEVPVPGGHFGDGDPVHQDLVALAVVLQVPDGDELQPPLLGLLLEGRGAQHGAILPHDLTAQAHLPQAGQAHEVHGGFGVAVALQDPVVLGQQGEHVAGAAEVLGFGVGVHALSGGEGPLGGGDARGGVHVVDGDGESGLVVVGVPGDHLGELELLDVPIGHGHADEALAVGGHEVDVLRGGKLCRADEVPLVLPVGVVGAEDHLALAQVLQGLFNGVVLKHGVIPFPAQKPQRVKKSRVIPEGGGASA